MRADSLTDIRASIGVKRLGELDYRPFRAAAKRKYPHDVADSKALELYSLWEGNLKDSNWFPFKVVTDDGDGGTKVSFLRKITVLGVMGIWGTHIY